MSIITVSDSAITQIKEYFSTHEKKSVRIVSLPGCGGVYRLVMTLDEATDKDVKVIKEDLEFIVDQELTNLVGNIEIDYSTEYNVFHITSEKELPPAQGEECTACSCCS
jgi:Fe-S cluster assembly iron-binding protein IscA